VTLQRHWRVQPLDLSGRGRGKMTKLCSTTAAETAKTRYPRENRGQRPSMFEVQTKTPERLTTKEARAVNLIATANTRPTGSTGLQEPGAHRFERGKVVRPGAPRPPQCLRPRRPPGPPGKLAHLRAAHGHRTVSAGLRCESHLTTQEP